MKADDAGDAREICWPFPMLTEAEREKLRIQLLIPHGYSQDVDLSIFAQYEREWIEAFLSAGILFNIFSLDNVLNVSWAWIAPDGGVYRNVVLMCRYPDGWAERRLPAPRIALEEPTAPTPLSAAKVAHPDPFAQWPKCHKCSEKVGKYVRAERYRVDLDDGSYMLRVVADCHGEKWTHKVDPIAAAAGSEPYALFAPGYDA